MLRALASVLPYVTLLTVVIGVVFGVITALQFRRARSLTAAVELVHAIQNADFAEGIQRIVELPERAPPERVLRSPDMMRAAYAVSHVYESVAVLVFYRLLPLYLVDRLMGGYVRASWVRLAPYVHEQRARLGPMFGEWFQWLAERIEERPAPGKQLGAPIAHRRWRPRFG